MSSKPEAQNEPTMEEILASIRRIISEDEPQDGKPAGPAAPAPTPKPAVAAPAPESAPAAPPPPSAEAAAGGRGADNILELTKMVAEDGSIIDLEAQPETVEGAPEEAPEALTEAAGEEAEAAEEAPEAASEEVAAEPEPQPESVPEPEAEAEAAEEAAEEPAEEPGEEAAEAADEVVAEEAAVEIAAAEEDLGAEEGAGQAAAGQGLAPAGVDDGNEYVSADTSALATASLAAVTKAAMANRQGGAVAIGGGRTLEELVRESLAPELKGWLDENLPDLVERIVREEIRKMVRRAEDQ